MDICISAEEQFQGEPTRLDLIALRYRLHEEVQQAKRNLREAQETLELARKLQQHYRMILPGSR